MISLLSFWQKVGFATIHHLGNLWFIKLSVTFEKFFLIFCNFLIGRWLDIRNLSDFYSDDCINIQHNSFTTISLMPFLCTLPASSLIIDSLTIQHQNKKTSCSNCKQYLQHNYSLICTHFPVRKWIIEQCDNRFVSWIIDVLGLLDIIKEKKTQMMILQLRYSDF